MVYVVCDYREQFDSRLTGVHFNPHPSYSNIEDLMNACSEQNIDCEYYGGIEQLIHDVDNKIKYDKNTLFLNYSDGLTQPHARLQAPVLLELMGVNYTGSSPFTVALMCNKYYAKMALSRIIIDNLYFPHGILITKNMDKDILHNMNIQYPAIIKPNNDGFSMGITSNSIVHEYSSVLKQIENLFSDYDEVLIEDYIAGMDASVFLMGNKDNLIINEIIVYKTYGSLYLENAVRGIDVKANKLSEKLVGTTILSSKLTEQLKFISRKIFSLLNARDIARIDYRITTDGKIYFIEINSCPVLAKHSDAEIVCESAGVTYSELIRLYIDIAQKRCGFRKQNI